VIRASISALDRARDESEAQPRAAWRSLGRPKLHVDGKARVLDRPARTAGHRELDLAMMRPRRLRRAPFPAYDEAFRSRRATKSGLPTVPRTRSWSTEPIRWSYVDSVRRARAALLLKRRRFARAKRRRSPTPKPERGRSGTGVGPNSRADAGKNARCTPGESACRVPIRCRNKTRAQAAICRAEAHEVTVRRTIADSARPSRGILRWEQQKQSKSGIRHDLQRQAPREMGGQRVRRLVWQSGTAVVPSRRRRSMVPRKRLGLPGSVGVTRQAGPTYCSSARGARRAAVVPASGTLARRPWTPRSARGRPRQPRRPARSRSEHYRSVDEGWSTGRAPRPYGTCPGGANCQSARADSLAKRCDVPMKIVGRDMVNLTTPQDIVAEIAGRRGDSLAKPRTARSPQVWRRYSIDELPAASLSGGEATPRSARLVAQHAERFEEPARAGGVAVSVLDWTAVFPSARRLVRKRGRDAHVSACLGVYARLNRDDRDFVCASAGELRQGALESIVLDAVGTAPPTHFARGDQQSDALRRRRSDGRRQAFRGARPSSRLSRSKLFRPSTDDRRRAPRTRPSRSREHACAFEPSRRRARAAAPQRDRVAIFLDTATRLTRRGPRSRIGRTFGQNELVLDGEVIRCGRMVAEAVQ